MFATGSHGSFEGSFEYLPALPLLRHGTGYYLSHFASLFPYLTTHVKGNPPGPLVALHLLGVGSPGGLAALCIGLGAFSAPLAYELGRTLGDEQRGRIAGSADRVFAVDPAVRRDLGRLRVRHARARRGVPARPWRSGGARGGKHRRGVRVVLLVAVARDSGLERDPRAAALGMAPRGRRRSGQSRSAWSRSTRCWLSGTGTTRSVRSARPMPSTGTGSPRPGRTRSGCSARRRRGW